MFLGGKMDTGVKKGGLRSGITVAIASDRAQWEHYVQVGSWTIATRPRCGRFA
jgi:hypothetical protein